jgi:hypothetical protein
MKGRVEWATKSVTIAARRSNGDRDVFFTDA